MSVPKRINPRWLQQRHAVLACTSKSRDDGTDNPTYVALAAELAAAEAELDRWEAFVSWVDNTLGLRLNSYPFRADGSLYDAGQVFLRKDKQTRQTSYLTVQEAWDRYQQSRG